jgi:hypothetical protein
MPFWIHKIYKWIQYCLHHIINTCLLISLMPTSPKLYLTNHRMSTSKSGLQIQMGKARKQYLNKLIIEYIVDIPTSYLKIWNHFTTMFSLKETKVLQNGYIFCLLSTLSFSWRPFENFWPCFNLNNMIWFVIFYTALLLLQCSFIMSHKGDNGLQTFKMEYYHFLANYWRRRFSFTVSLINGFES